MKKLFLLLLLALPLASCNIYIDDLHPNPPHNPEIITNIRAGGANGAIVAVVVNNEIREGSYYGPVLAEVDGNRIYETAYPYDCLAIIDGAYIIDNRYGNTLAFINGPYVKKASPYEPILAFMDGNHDNIAGGLAAVYMLLYY